MKVKRTKKGQATEAASMLSSKSLKSSTATGANKYENSKVFSILKVQNDKLEGNLTTSQYLETLDRYLTGALQIITEHTRFMDVVIIGLIGWQEVNYRRRVALTSKCDFIEAATLWLLQTRQKKAATISSLRLDRGVALLACHAFLNECADYEKVISGTSLRTQESLSIVCLTERRLLAPGGNLSHAIALAKHQTELAAKYRGDILSKYFKLAIVAAQRDYVHYFNCRISLDDMCSEYILASARAIDKCDYEKGPLTTHIRNWFFTARKHCSRRYDHGRNESGLPDDNNSMGGAGSSGAVNIGTDEDSEYSSHELATDAIDTTLIKGEASDTIRFLSKLADPIGDTRKILGIEELLSIKEKKLLGSKNF